MRLLGYILNVTFQYPENYNIHQHSDSSSAGYHNFYHIALSSVHLDSPSLWLSVNFTEPCETTGNITVLYIIIVIFLDTKQKTNDSGAVGSKHNNNLSVLNFVMYASLKVS
jgi:hypothetical protein